MGLSLVGLGVGVLWLQGEAGNEWLRGRIEAGAAPMVPEGRLTVGSLRTDLFWTWELGEVVLEDHTGRAILSIDEAELELQPVELLSGRLHASRLRLGGVVADLEQASDGTLDLVHALGLDVPSTEPSGPWTGLPLPIEVDFVHLDGLDLSLRDAEDLVLAQLGGLQLRSSFKGEGARLVLPNLDVTASAVEPALGELRLSGKVGFDEDAAYLVGFQLQSEHSLFVASGGLRNIYADPTLGLTLELRPLGAEDVALLAGSEDYLDQDVSGVLRLSGPLYAIGLEGTLFSDTGTLDLAGGLDLNAEPMGWHLLTDADDFDLAALVGLDQPTFLSGRYRVRGAGTSWPDDLSASIEVDGRDEVIFGEVLRATHLRGELSGGVLQLTEARIEHELGQVEIKGPVDLNTSVATLRASVDLPNLAGLERFGVAGIEGSLRASGKTKVSWGGEQLRADATLEVSSPRVAAQGYELRELGGPLTLRMKGEEVLVSGTLEGQSLRGESISARSLALGVEAWHRVGSDGAALQVDVAGVDVADGTLLVGRAVGPVTITMGGSELVVAGSVETTGVELPGTAWAGVQGPASFELRGDQLTGTLALNRDVVEPLIDLDFEGNLATGGWVLPRLAMWPGGDLAFRSEGPISFRLDGSDLRDIDLRLGGPSARIQVEGDLVLSALDRTPLRLKVQQLSLVDLAAVVAELSPAQAGSLDGLEGELDLELAITEAAGELALEGHGSVAGFTYGEQVKGAELRWELGGRPDLPRVVLWVDHRGQHLADLDLQLPLHLAELDAPVRCSDPIEAMARFDPGDLALAREVFPDLPASLQGELSAELRLLGPVCDPEIYLLAGVSSPQGMSGEHLRLDLDLVRRDQAFQLNAVVEEGLAQRLEVRGTGKTPISDLFEALRTGEPLPELTRPQTWVSSTRMRIRPQRMPLEELARFVSVPNGLRGRLEGDLTVTGPVDSLTAQGALRLKGAGIGASEMEAVSLELRETQGTHIVKGEATVGDTGKVTLHAVLPMDIETTASAQELMSREGFVLSVDVVEVPVSVLEGMGLGLRQTAGSFSGNLKGKGSLNQPHLSGELSLAGGAAIVDSLGVQFQDARFTTRITPDRISIDEAYLLSRPVWALGRRKPGSLSFKGSVRLDGFKPRSVSAVAEMDSFQVVHTNEAQLALSGGLQASGTWPAVTVRGKLGISEGRFVADESFFRESPNLALDPRIEITRSRGRDPREVVVPQAPPANPLSQFDVELVLDLRRRLNLVAQIPMQERYGKQIAEMTSMGVDAVLDCPDLRVTWRNEEISLQGQLELVDGTATVIGADFDISGGQVSFAGGDVSDPFLQMEAVRDTGTYGTVDVAISGPVSSLDVGFSSEDYPNDADILSLLIFGFPASELTTEDGQSALFQAAVASFANRLESAVGASMMGRFEFDGDAVRFAMPVSDRVTLTYEISTAAQQDSNVNQLIFEWLISRRVYAEVITGDAGESSADIFWRWRF